MGFRASVIGVALTLALAAGGSASAATYAYTISGSGFAGSGTLTTTGAPTANPYPCATCAPGPGFHVGSLTGDLNGDAVTLLPPITYAGNDNLIYPNSTAGEPYLDWGDLGFSANGVDYNAFNGNYASQPGDFLAASSGGGLYGNPITFTLTAVPEPATWAMMMLGLFGLGTMLRSRKQRGAAAVAG